MELPRSGLSVLNLCAVCILWVSLTCASVRGASLLLTPNRTQFHISSSADRPKSIDCSVEEYSGPPLEKGTVQFYFKGNLIGQSGNGKDIRQLPDSAILSFYTADKEDEGTYECRATVDGESLVKQFNVVVLKKFEWVDEQPEQHPMQGTQARIQCKFNLAKNEYKLFWTKDGESISEGESIRTYGFELDRQVLLIDNFDKRADDGNYTCSVVYKVKGETLSQTIRVEGNEKPRLAEHHPKAGQGKEDGDVSLQCGAFGTPTPTVTWFKVSTGAKIDDDADESKYTLSDRGDELSIFKLGAADAGEYRCVAVNAVGQAEGTTSLSVLLKPVVSVAVPEVVVQVGTAERTLQCSYKSDDEDTKAQWRSHSGDIFVVQTEEEQDAAARIRAVSSEPGSIDLVVKDLSAADDGEYFCEATNQAGTSSQPVRIIIQEDPKVTDLRPSVAKAVDTQEEGVSFTCEVSGRPTPKIHWLRDGNRVADGDEGYKLEELSEKSSKLVITPSGTRFGNYSCRAENDIGQSQASAMFYRIELPGTPVIVEQRLAPTYINLSVTNWNGLNEGQLPEQVAVKYKVYPTLEAFPSDEELKADLMSEDNTLRVVLDYVDGSFVKVRELEPSKWYGIILAGINRAGETAYSEPLKLNTPAPQAPEAPHFKQAVFDCSKVKSWDECEVAWNTPEHRGSLIDQYRFRFAKNESSGMPGEPTSDWIAVQDTQAVKLGRAELSVFEADSVYRLWLYAHNDIGNSEDSEHARAIFKTPSAIFMEHKGGVPTGAIASIVIILVLIVLLVVDVVCYYVNQCGLLMCVCVNLCGRTPPQHKSKEIMAEEGLPSSNGDKVALKGADAPYPDMEPEDKPDPNEVTPMFMGSRSAAVGKVDTSV